MHATNRQTALVILLTHLQVEVPESKSQAADFAGTRSLATVLSNLASFGYTLSTDAMARLRRLSTDDLAVFWSELEPALAEVTGANRKMAEVVVYKNFPSEVLNQTQAQYWFNQMCMYMGAPNEWFTQPEAERAPLNEKLKLKVLSLAPQDALQRIRAGLYANQARWTAPQQEQALFLGRHFGSDTLDLSEFGFKENGVRLMASLIDMEVFLVIKDATDVLRLAAAMSGSDPSLRTPVKFVHFNRAERRLLVSLLEQTANLEDDFALRPKPWKLLLSYLHPGDYKVPRVMAAYNLLYKDALVTFNSEVETKLRNEDSAVLELLQTRPGDLVRRLHALYGKFGMAAVNAFARVAPKLDTLQLLKLKGYLSTINGRQKLAYAPRGNWSALKLVANEKQAFDEAALKQLLAVISAMLQERLAAVFPHGVAMDLDVENIKLQNNDQELASYGRGTVFSIPDNVTFLRTASYWKLATSGHNWFDNGWAFFDESWAPMGACCWNAPSFTGQGQSPHANRKLLEQAGAIFSGDPTNGKDLQGRACQMIDLYIDRLVAQGVRYAAWNVLCYSRVSFSQAEEVLATLQWGEVAETGQLYEPARAQMVFPLKGEAMTKYVAYVDLVTRKVVYMDANLPGSTQSMECNLTLLQEQMPAYVEYLASLPSVADLFINAPEGTGPEAVSVLYTDAEKDLPEGAKAYVFKPENSANSFEQVDLLKLLGILDAAADNLLKRVA